LRGVQELLQSRGMEESRQRAGGRALVLFVGLLLIVGCGSPMTGGTGGSGGGTGGVGGTGGSSTCPQSTYPTSVCCKALSEDPQTDRFVCDENGQWNCPAYDLLASSIDDCIVSAGSGGTSGGSGGSNGRGGGTGSGGSTATGGNTGSGGFAATGGSSGAAGGGGLAGNSGAAGGGGGRVGGSGGAAGGGGRAGGSGGAGGLSGQAGTNGTCGPANNGEGGSECGKVGITCCTDGVCDTGLRCITGAVCARECAVDGGVASCPAGDTCRSTSACCVGGACAALEVMVCLP
jgi:hypothetical protein